MRTKMFTMYDKKMAVYQQPVLSTNRLTCMRMITDGLQRNPDSVMTRHPEDYQLYEIGEFFDDTGLINAEKNLSFVCELVELLAEERK